MNPPKPSLRRCIALAVVLGLPALVSAQSTATWLGTTSTAWGVSSNWDPDIPGAGDHVVVADTTPNNAAILDTSRIVGSVTHGDTGTRTALFTFQTGANTLTLTNGVVANGNFTGGVGLSFNGNLTLSENQTWSVGGDPGAVTVDRGVRMQADGTQKTVTLNGNLTKTGPGQLVLANLTIGGAGDFIVNQGSLKINAASSALITVGGAGNITVNNDARLLFSRNTGTMSVTRDIVMNDTATLGAGGGGSGATATVDSAITWNGTHNLTMVNNNPFTFAGPWSGAGTINRGGGQAVTITGTSPGFSGTLNLQSGFTTNAGSFTGMTLNLSGGTNWLTGSLAGCVVNSSASTNIFSGTVSGSTVTLTSGRATLNGGFPGSTIHVNGGTTDFSPAIGNATININQSGIRTASVNNQFGTGMVNLKTTGSDSRIDLNNVTMDNDFTLDSTATTGFSGALRATGGALSTVNGTVTVTKSVGNGGHLAGDTGATLRLLGPLEAGGGMSTIVHRLGTVEYGGGGSSVYQLQVTDTARLVANNGLATGTALRLGGSAAATLDLNGFSQTLARIGRNVPDFATGTGYNAVITNGAATAVTLTLSASSPNYTYSGTIVGGAGALHLAKAGANTVTLAGTNTYTGDTTITAGGLTISGAGRLGGGTYAGAIANNGAFTYASSQPQTLAGVLSGNGSLTQQGSGTLTISLNSGHSLSGPVTVAGGVLTLGSLTASGTVTFNTPSLITVQTNATLDLPMLHGSSGQTATWQLSPITLESGATLRFRASTGSDTHNLGANIANTGNTTIDNNGGSYANNINLSGVLSGSGTISNLATTASGATTTIRTLTLNNPSTTYSGDWFVDYTATTSDDFVALSSTAAGALGTGTVTLDDRARLICGAANGLSSLAGVSLLKATAWVDVNQSTTLQSLQGTVGVVTNNTAGAVTLTVNAGSFSGAIRNNGPLSLVKATAGTLTLGGVNDYTGATTVNDGTLLVNGSLAAASAVTVNGGTLGGNGTINGTVAVNAGGTLAPGTSIGTLTVNNTVTLAGTTALEINKAGMTLTSDLVTGITTLNCGGSVTVSATGDALAAGDEFTVFSAGMFNGSFASITPAPGAGLAWDTNKLATEGKLLVHHRPVAGPNVASVARGATAILGGAKLLANNSDADGDPLTIVAVTAVSGSATLVGPNISYTAPGSGSTDTISYTVSDGRGGETNGIVTVTLTSPDAPSLNVVSGPVLDDNQFKVTFAGVPGLTYTVEDSTVSPVGPWSFYTNLTAGPNGLFELVATNHPYVPARYFRTVAP